MNERPNLNYIKELSGGDKEFENKLIQIVKKELPSEIEVYTKFINDANFLRAAEIVHKLKHKFSILGLVNSYQVAIDYEEDLKKNSLKLREKFQKILTSMTIFIKEI
jgi:HPt (histidine-containing phosphotransfer) domain-containing protein